MAAAMLADVTLECARMSGGGRNDDRELDRVAEPGVRVDADDHERGGVEEDGSDSDREDEDEGDGDGEGSAVTSAAVV